MVLTNNVPGVYYNATMSIAYSTGATLTFKFNGTALYYFVDTNNDHGKFSVKVDDRTYPELNGASPADQLINGRCSDSLQATPQIDKGRRRCL